MAISSDRTPQQRAALVTVRLVRGDQMTTREIAVDLGMSYQGARRLMGNLSGPGLPVTRGDDGKWRYIY